jgi:lysophospholipase L1-like esterase
MNAWLREHATRAHATYADYFAVMSDGKGGMRDGLSSDHVHPTEAGYAAMGPVAEAALLRALSVRH